MEQKVEFLLVIDIQNTLSTVFKKMGPSEGKEYKLPDKADYIAIGRDRAKRYINHFIIEGGQKRRNTYEIVAYNDAKNFDLAKEIEISDSNKNVTRRPSTKEDKTTIEGLIKEFIK